MDDDIHKALARRVVSSNVEATMPSIREWLREHDDHSRILNAASIKIRAHKVACIVREWREEEVCI
jgi:hypothetical protein